MIDKVTRSFQALGGVTRRGIYDNMRTAVDKVQRGKQLIVNARFAALYIHYQFDRDFCNVAWRRRCSGAGRSGNDVPLRKAPGLRCSSAM